jgi:hypothetical protein
VLGGYAVGHWGYPRATNDLDIWVAISPENAEKISAALQDFGFTGEQVPAEIFQSPKKVFRMGIPPMRIEILTSPSGVTFQDCYARRVMGLLDDVPVPFIGLEDLKINKKASGRSKDTTDLEHLP